MAIADKSLKIISIDLKETEIKSIYGFPFYLFDGGNNTYVRQRSEGRRVALIAPRKSKFITDGSIFNMSVGNDILRVREFKNFVILEPYGLLVDKRKTSFMENNRVACQNSQECQMIPSMAAMNISEIIAINNGLSTDVIEGKKVAAQVNRFGEELDAVSPTMAILKKYIRYCVDSCHYVLDIPALADFILEQDKKPFTSAVEEAKRATFTEDFYESGHKRNQDGDFTSFLVSRALMLQYQGILYTEPQLIDEVKKDSVVELPNLYYMRIDPVAVSVLWKDDYGKERVAERKAMFEGVSSIHPILTSESFGTILNLTRK